MWVIVPVGFNILFKQSKFNNIDFQAFSLYFLKVIRQSMDVAASIVVTGLVQGVGFRYYVYHHAQRMGLAGFVENLHSGEVRIEAEGERSLIEELIREVRIGPRSAEVSNVHVDWRKPEHRFAHFEIR